MKFLADENFPRQALFALRKAESDVRSIAEDNPGSSDEEVGELCERETRILLTFDKDFGELVFRHGLRVGSAVVLFRLALDSTAEAVTILQSLIDTGARVEGVFCVATRERVRIRQLHHQTDLPPKRE